MTPLTDSEIVARVTVRIRGQMSHVPHEQVETVVVAVLDRFGTSRVRDFLPVLVEREALAILRHRSDHDAA